MAGAHERMRQGTRLDKERDTQEVRCGGRLVIRIISSHASDRWCVHHDHKKTNFLIQGQVFEETTPD